MKKVFLTLGLLLPLIAIIFSSNSPSMTPPNPKIGAFELYRTVIENDIISYFGICSKSDTLKDENEKGEEVDVNRYLYFKPNSSSVSLGISIVENRIAGFWINSRDIKYAINGKLMVGDTISKVSQLGYPVEDLRGAKGKVLYPPIYKRGTYDICYYFEVFCDSNNIITRISMLEDIGV